MGTFWTFKSCNIRIFAAAVRSVELCRPLLVGGVKPSDFVRFSKTIVWIKFSFFLCCFSWCPLLFFRLCSFPPASQRGSIRTNPASMAYCPLQQQKTPSTSFTACLLLYSQSAEAWLQHWTMLRLSVQAHTAKIPQWGAVTSSLYNCHPGASVSILYVSLPHQQPASHSISPMVISPNTHIGCDVSSCTRGRAARFGIRLITSISSPSTMYELQHFILKTCKFYMPQLSAE